MIFYLISSLNHKLLYIFPLGKGDREARRGDEAGEGSRTLFFFLARKYNNRYTTPAFVPRAGIEPAPFRFSVESSTTELPRPILTINYKP